MKLRATTTDSGFYSFLDSSEGRCLTATNFSSTKFQVLSTFQFSLFFQSPVVSGRNFESIHKRTARELIFFLEDVIRTNIILMKMKKKQISLSFFMKLSQNDENRIYLAF